WRSNWQTSTAAPRRPATKRTRTHTAEPGASSFRRPSRHSGAGRNPLPPRLTAPAQSKWIPACPGMTSGATLPPPPYRSLPTSAMPKSQSSFLHRCLPQVLLLACAALAPAAPAFARPQYDVTYAVRFLPDTGQAAVTIRVAPDDGRITRLDLAMDQDRYTDVEGDGEVTRADGRTLWIPPADGGALRYRYRIDHQRGTSGYD